MFKCSELVMKFWYLFQDMKGIKTITILKEISDAIVGKEKLKLNFWY